MFRQVKHQRVRIFFCTVRSGCLTEPGSGVASTQGPNGLNHRRRGFVAFWHTVKTETTAHLLIPPHRILGCWDNDRIAGLHPVGPVASLLYNARSCWHRCPRRSMCLAFAGQSGLLFGSRLVAGPRIPAAIRCTSSAAGCHVGRDTGAPHHAASRAASHT